MVMLHDMVVDQGHTLGLTCDLQCMTWVIQSCTACVHCCSIADDVHSQTCTCTMTHARRLLLSLPIGACLLLCHLVSLLAAICRGIWLELSACIDNNTLPIFVQLSALSSVDICIAARCWCHQLKCFRPEASVMQAQLDMADAALGLYGIAFQELQRHVGIECRYLCCLLHNMHTCL